MEAAQARSIAVPPGLALAMEAAGPPITVRVTGGAPACAAPAAHQLSAASALSAAAFANRCTPPLRMLPRRDTVPRGRLACAAGGDTAVGVVARGERAACGAHAQRGAAGWGVPPSRAQPHKRVRGGSTADGAGRALPALHHAHKRPKRAAMP